MAEGAQPIGIPGLLAVCFALTACTALTVQAQQPPEPTSSKLARLALEARDNPPKPEAASLETERLALQTSLDRVDTRLRNAPGENAWRDYLLIEQLRGVASGTDPVNARQLDDCCQRLRLAVVVWPDGDIKALRASCERFASLWRVVSDPNHAQTRASRLEQLSELLTAIHGDPTDEQATQMAEIIGWLSQRDERGRWSRLSRRLFSSQI